MSVVMKNNNLFTHNMLLLRAFEVRGSLMLSCVQLFVTLWTVAHQAPLSLEFSK